MAGESVTIGVWSIVSPADTAGRTGQKYVLKRREMIKKNKKIKKEREKKKKFPDLLLL